jgi:hypothetical protein
MRHTPRHMRSSSGRSGGIGTLIGNGWLREQPHDRVPEVQKWQARSKSFLRKCMFMPVPDEIRRLAPQISQAALLPAAPRRPEPEIVPHRRDPRKDVREFAAYVPPLAIDPHVAIKQARAIQMQNAQKAAVAAAIAPAQAWWEDPVALGSLLILVPPVGLAAVWSSKRYSSDARWALTVMTALMMCLMTAIAIAVVAMH